MARRFFNRKLTAEPTLKPGSHEVYEVEAEGVKADVHKDALVTAIRGSKVSLVVPDLPWLRKSEGK